jgi:hypothetical protein
MWSEIFNGYVCFKRNYRITLSDEGLVQLKVNYKDLSFSVNLGYVILKKWDHKEAQRLAEEKASQAIKTIKNCLVEE